MITLPRVFSCQKMWDKPIASDFPCISSTVEMQAKALIVKIPNFPISPRFTQEHPTSMVLVSLFSPMSSLDCWCDQVEPSSYSTKSPKLCLSQGAAVFIDRDNCGVWWRRRVQDSIGGNFTLGFHKIIPVHAK